MPSRKVLPPWQNKFHTTPKEVKLNNRKQLLISPTAFKGTLSPWEAARIMRLEARRFIPDQRITVLPLADGGDGTLEVLGGAHRIQMRFSKVRGPLGTPVKAHWGIVNSLKKGFPGPVAVIEMARASGLALLKRPNRILEATTFGTGELILNALRAGCRTILIGVGGTATGDGGAGALEALGLKFFDKFGARLSSRPRDLINLHRLDWSGFDARICRTKIFVICDVENPLLGPHGSARTFGPQKGASPKEVVFLERFLEKWSSFAKVQTKNCPGAGAAGALAFGLSAFARARLVPGTSFIMDVLNWKIEAKKADYILTGEGRLDRTSFSGKVVGEICAKARGAKVLVVCGETPLSHSFLKGMGIRWVGEMGPGGLRRPAMSLALATRKVLGVKSPLSPPRQEGGG